MAPSAPPGSATGTTTYYYHPREGNVFTGVCNSVHWGVPGPGRVCLVLGGVPGPKEGGGLPCPGGVWSGGVWSGGCLLPGGCLVPGGAWSLGGAWSWGVPGQGGAWSRECLVLKPPDGYCCGRYTSYWNAFLFG